nr:tail fiber protein [uncultured Aquabacterium sp.]
MSDPFVGEVRMFAGNFAPTGWAFCNGQLLPLSQNTALFAILGTAYGGDGRSTFALPNLMDAMPVGVGQGPGLEPVGWGQSGGVDSVTLQPAQMPPHSHAVNTAVAADSKSPGSERFLAPTGDASAAYRGPSKQAPLSAAAVSLSGGGRPHNNRPPVQVVSFIIALQGVFPARS